MSGNYDAFLAAFRKKESGDNYAKLSPLKYAGAYQMGKAALIEAGFIVHPGYYVTDNKWETAVWTDKAKKAGINCIADFLGTKADKNGLPAYEDYYPMIFDKKLQKKVPSTTSTSRIALDPTKAETARKAQDEAVRAYDTAVWRQICAARADTFVGEEINGVRLTPSGLIAGYRLCGMGTHTNSADAPHPGLQPGLRAYLQSRGKEDGRDENDASVSQYVALFNDYEVPFQKVHDGPAGLSVPKPRTNKKKVDKKADNGLNHPHAAEMSAWYQQDYYNTKHWNIASRLYHLNHHDDSYGG